MIRTILTLGWKIVAELRQASAHPAEGVHPEPPIQTMEMRSR